uniref:Uncharacterized protein n=1 Tax=Pipistrellus kuhlii TaxID=59472 RepID=A0A7J7W3R2_PIPKU|nr:hypothetical protein mPipKuh1_008183 [Pipistrellus kuhlii]
MSKSEGPVSHTTEGQDRPEVRVATWATGEPGPMSGQRTPPPKLPRPNKPPTSKPLSPNTKRAIFNSLLEHSGRVNNTWQEDLEPNEAESKAPAQEAEAAPPVTPKVLHPEEQDVELEAPPSAELSSPPTASPAAAVEPGPAPEETEAPPPLDGEPSLEPVLVPAWEEALPVEGPTQGPKAPAQEAETSPPVTSDIYPEEQDAELEASPPAELSSPPAASPAAAVEPGLAPEEMEAPPPLDGEPSLEPVLVPASEEALPMEGPAQGPQLERMIVTWLQLNFYTVLEFFS